MTILARKSKPIDKPRWPPPSKIDRQFFACASARFLCRAPVRWVLFGQYYREYCRTVQNDEHAFAALQIDVNVLRAIRRRAGAAIRTVAACSAWYALSSAILRAGFGLGLVGAFLAIVATALPSVGLTTNALAIIAASFVVVLIFAYASLWASSLAARWRSAGLSFDIFWHLGSAVLLWLVIAEGQIPTLNFPQLAFASLVIVALQCAAYGVATYASVILIATIGGRAIFTRTTNIKKRYPEEEIIETLIVAISYIETNRAIWPQFKFRRNLSRELDWIADRLEFDFFKNYPRGDPLTADWTATVGVKTASAVRELKQSTMLPSDVRLTQAHDTLCTMLIDAASGNWAALPVSDEASSVDKKSRILSAAQTSLSIIVPLGGAVLVQLYLSDPYKTSVFTALLGLAAVNLLALLNPAGFDKQIDAAKTVADALRGQSK